MNKDSFRYIYVHNGIPFSHTLSHGFRPHSHQDILHHLWFLPSIFPLMILFAPLSDLPYVSESHTSGCCSQILCVTEVSIMSSTKMSSTLLTLHHICQEKSLQLDITWAHFEHEKFPVSHTSLVSVAQYEFLCSSSCCQSKLGWGTYEMSILSSKTMMHIYPKQVALLFIQSPLYCPDNSTNTV